MDEIIAIKDCHSIGIAVNKHLIQVFILLFKHNYNA